MKAYEARITINATREKIWGILTDAGQYPSWNTTLNKLEGTVARGNDLKVWAKISPGRAFPAHVSEFQPPERMVWSFSMPLGFFKGARTFSLLEKAGAVEFHTREEFTGWASALINRTMPDLQPTFDEWASCLKRRAEQA